MSVDRRFFLGTLAATVVSLRAAAQGAVEVPAPSALTAEAHVTADWTVLEAKSGALRLVGEQATETTVWCYGGEVPGPLLRVKKGAEIKVRLVNALTQPTSLCWHGVRIENALDGVAGLTQKPVAPGESFDYRFTPPDSGLFWYHPHAWPNTAEQMGRGLYGVLIVDEAEPPATDLDLLVVLDDWTLDDKAQIRGDFLEPEIAKRAGRVGPLVTVNSKAVPLVTTLRPGSRIRLRLLSAMSARIMIMSFVNVRPMVQAIDGQPCDVFEPVRQTIPVGPGARFDITIDLPAEPGKTASLQLRGDKEGDPGQALLVFKTLGDTIAPRLPIKALVQNASLPAVIPLERALKMDLVIDGGFKPPGQPAPEPRKASPANKKIAPSKATAPVTPIIDPDPRHLWTINGVASDGFSGKPLFTVKRGAPVSLAFVNRSAFAQQIHIHGHAVRLLHDLDDGWEPYWRDAVLVADGRTKHVAFVADRPGKWAIESLILDRQVTGLAAWFEVT